MGLEEGVGQGLDSPHGLVDQRERPKRLVAVKGLGAGDALYVAHLWVRAVLKHGTNVTRAP